MAGYPGSSLRADTEEHDEFEEYRRKSYSAGNLLATIQTTLQPPDDDSPGEEDEQEGSGYTELQVGSVGACGGGGGGGESKRYRGRRGKNKGKGNVRPGSCHFRRKMGAHAGSTHSGSESGDDGNLLQPPTLYRQRSRSLPFNQADFHHLMPPSPSDEDTEDQIVACQRVRRFSSGNKGLVNLGDTVNLRKVPSRRGSGASESDAEAVTKLYYDAEEQRLRMGRQRAHGSSEEPPRDYKVLIIGSHGVGKESLTRQLETSEYVGYVMEPSEPGEPYSSEAATTVPVVLDGKNYTLDIVRSHSLQVFQRHPDADLCLVMYGIDEERSFFAALEVIKEIRSWEVEGYKSTGIYLVGNKADLERNRVISPSKAKEMAAKHDCKFMEISVVLNHQVDELLVGMLKLLKRSSSRRPSLIDCLKGTGGKKKKEKHKGIRGSVSEALGKASSKLMKSCDDLLLIFKSDK